MKSIFLLGCLLISIPLSSLAQTTAPFQTIEKVKPSPLNFDIKAAPSQGDWQRFQILTRQELESIWTFHQAKHLNLKDWSWQWRLGWVRRCGGIPVAWCESLIRDGIDDPAVVVRAEAAEQFAVLKRQKATQADVQMLANAYKNQKNFRHGQPLFVCERILHALLSLQTLEAKKVGKRLAEGNRKTKAYWSALIANELGTKTSAKKIKM